MKRNIVPILALMLLVTACSSLFKTTVTLTSVVDSAMKDWAQLSVAGKTTPQIDAAVSKAHDQYRQACVVARDALVTYKNTGQNTEYIAALSGAQTAALGIIEMISPLISPKKADALKNNLKKANTI